MGLGDGKPSANPGACTALKPASSKQCAAVVVGDLCDDNDDSTMDDKCVTEKKCAGKAKLAAELTFGVAAADIANATAFKASIRANMASTLKEAGMASASADLCTVTKLAAGSTVVGTTSAVNAEDTTSDKVDGAVNEIKKEDSPLSTVELSPGKPAGAAQTEGILVYSYYKTAAKCPACDPVACDPTCDKDESTLPDEYSCYKAKNKEDPYPEPTLDQDCVDNGVMKPSSVTLCSATPPCVTFDYAGSNFPDCPTACGSPASEVSRSVTCLGSDGKTYADSKCSGTKPATISVCEAVVCKTYDWVNGTFTPAACPAECGADTVVMSRLVQCLDNTGEEVDPSEVTLRCTKTKPITSKTCISEKCQKLGEIVVAQITLDLDFASLPVDFPQLVIVDVASALKISQDRVVVNDWAAGSVVVNITIVPDDKGVALPQSALQSGLAKGVAIAGGTTQTAPVVLVSTDFHYTIAKATCPAGCGLPTSTVADTVQCINNASREVAADSFCKEAKPTSTTTCVAPQCDCGGYVCPTDFSRITDPTSNKCTAGAKCTAKECCVAVATPEPTPTPAPAPVVLAAEESSGSGAIIGIVVAAVVIGGAAIFFLTKKKGGPTKTEVSYIADSESPTSGKTPV